MVVYIKLEFLFTKKNHESYLKRNNLKEKIEFMGNDF